MSFINLNVGQFQLGTGTDISWKYTQFFGTLFFQNANVYLQRSSTKSNWPLQPYYEKGNISHTQPAAPSEAGWETIYNFSFTAQDWQDMLTADGVGNPANSSHHLPYHYLDNTDPNSVPSHTFNYRLIAYFYEFDSLNPLITDYWSEFDWHPGTVTSLPTSPFKWVALVTSNVNAGVLGVATYPTDGSIYAVGSFSGTTVFGKKGSSTTISKTSAGSADGFLAKFSSAGEVIWVVTMEGTSNEGSSGVTVDGNGNPILTGRFSSNVTFKGTSGSPVTKTLAGSTDIFVAKYNAAGVLAWAKTYGGSIGDFGYYVSVDPSNNIYFACTVFSQNVDFGNSITISGFAYVIAKLNNSDGSTVWAIGYPTTDAGMNLRGFFVDINSNVYVCGTFNGSIDLGNGVRQATGFGQNMFFARYNSAGAYVWGKTVGLTSNQGCSAVGIIADTVTGTVTVGGGFASSGGNLGGGNLIAGAFLAGFALSDGHWLWDYLTGDLLDFAGRMSATENGDLVITARAQYPLNWGHGWAYGDGGSTYYVARFLNSGAAIGQNNWTIRSSVSGGEGNASAIDALNNNIIIGGNFQGLTNVDGDGTFGGHLSSSIPAGFIACYGAQAFFGV